MPHPQFPIGSGFGAATTAQAVLAGLDLSHATAIVTGGHSGLGLETTRALAQAGARVIVAARDAEAARAQTRDIARVQVEPLDLARLDSVRDFARRFLAGGQHVDMLICSAGIMACPETRVGPGWEAQFATNHLGHYALANLLWPALRSGARVVAVSSAGHHQSGMRWDDVQFTRATTNGWPTGSRKPRTPCLPCIWTSWDESMACAPFAASRQDLHAAATPPDAGRNDGRGLAGRQRPASRPQLQDRAARRGHPDLGSRLAAAGRHGRPVLRGLRRRRAGPGRSSSFAGVRPHAVDPEAAARLWALSAGLTGIDAFAAR